jgi:cell division transport system permease protein
MKINNIGYLMKEGIRGIFLHGFMSFAAVCVTVACLLIVGSFSCLTYNVSLMVEDLNKTNQIVVYVDEKLSEAEARSLTTPINVLDNVYRTEFVTREQALKDFIANHKEGELFSDMEASDLRHRIIVVLEDNDRMRETVAAIEKINGVGDISASYALAEGFSTIENVLHITSLVVIAVLLVVSLLIISNTVKLAMFDRRDEIAIMKMVGATNGFIRLPYVVEGFILGMLGAAVAFGLQWLLYDAMLVWLEEMQTLDLFSFVPFEELLVPMVCIFAAAGLFVGIVGSWTSIRKFLNV